MHNRWNDWLRQYPDAFPSGAPFEYFTPDQAEEAVFFAEKLVLDVRERVTSE